jgi:uncharacterized protein YabE (DUF348 family)
MKFWQTILLALGLSGAFLFVIYAGASADSCERQVLNIKRPYQIVEVFTNGRTGQTFVGTSSKVKLFDIAEEVGAAPYAEDRLSDFPGFKDFYGQRITLYRAPTYIVYDQNKELTYRSFTATVGELLTEKKTVLGEDDKINFSADTKLEEGMVVKITRVAKTKVIETEKIEYKTTKQDDPTLDKGKTKVKQAGVNGEKKLTYEVTRENGVEISKILLSSEVTKEAVSEILLVGTKPVITTACRFNDIVIEAANKYSLDPNTLCYRMMQESMGNANSDGGDYKGLFQYDPNLWTQVSGRAGYSGASIWDAKAQIFTTAWAWTHGYRSRWPNP